MDFNDTREEAAFRAQARAFLAANAEHAKSLMSTVGSTFSLILIDLDMRGENGFELIAEFHSHFPDLPIVAISGVYQRNVLESAKAMGATAALQKPIDSDWLPTIERARTKAAKN